MPYCYYCGSFVVKKGCSRCHAVQPGSFRKELPEAGDCGFVERMVKLALSVSVLSVLLVIGFNAFTLLLKILNA